MSEIKKRIEKLQKKMKEEGINAYYIPTSDFHFSEYISDHFKVREFFSGFTGSAGDLLVTEKEALLWTDGRYFLQAQKELEGSGIRLMKSGNEGVPTIYEYLKKELPKKGVLGFDGRTVDVKKAGEFEKCAHKLAYKKDLTSEIFKRPPFPSSPVEDLGEDITGMGTADKLGIIRKKLKENNTDSIFISRLDDIAYLLNIRGNDISFNPVVMSYLYITDEKAYFFHGDGKTDIAYQGLIIKPYAEVDQFLKSDHIRKKVCLDPSATSFLHYRLIKKRAGVTELTSFVQGMKCVKNETEIGKLKDIYLKDSLALTRFIKWMDENTGELDEIQASDKLLEFRKKIPEFRDLSFETISAYGENAAVVHYSPKKDSCSVIGKKGFYLVDSGGQYLGGTTDVTRTLVTGELSDEEKEAFTLVAAGMLDILNCVFPKGTFGYSLDALARNAMWKKGFDYKHGTGHGVGYMLNVHEGPCSVRSKAGNDDMALEPGMVISDEPGIYREGAFGVRIENILLVRNEKETSDGTFYSFESLTKVPLDDRAVDRSSFNDRQKEYYESYQKDVYDCLSPFLDEEERSWLKRYSGIEIHS